jgi:hypothetical protein
MIIIKKKRKIPSVRHQRELNQKKRKKMDHNNLYVLDLLSTIVSTFAERNRKIIILNDHLLFDKCQIINSNDIKSIMQVSHEIYKEIRNQFPTGMENKRNLLNRAGYKKRHYQCG